MPVKFATGWHPVVIAVETNAPPSSQPGVMARLRDIGVIQADGALVWPVDEAGTPVNIPRFVPASLLEDLLSAGTDSGEAPGRVLLGPDGRAWTGSIGTRRVPGANTPR